MKTTVIIGGRKPKLNYEKYKCHRKTIAEKLSEKILRDCNVSCDPTTFKRWNIGKWQRMNGEYVWTMHLTGKSLMTVGSTYAARELLKAKYRLELGVYNTNFQEYEIFPEEIKPDNTKENF